MEGPQAGVDKPWGETRVATGSTPTTWRFTGQREDATIGLYYFGARYYDPKLGRFIQPDTIVPEPGNPQSLNRYSYMLNNPLRYTDPTGRFTEEEICTYWGYCGEQAARKGLGDSLFGLLWKTAITWGDLLFMGDENGANTVAMFVLTAHEREGTYQYRAGLWGVMGERYGKPVDWQTAQAASRVAAYDAEQNVWEGMARQDAEAWTGHFPTVDGANSLGLAPGMYDYQFGTYVDLNGWWLAAAGVTVAAWFPGGLAAVGASAGLIKAVQWGSLAVDATGLVADAGRLDWLPGPVDATYPVVYYDPSRIGRAPWQLHVQPPGGAQ